MTCYECTHNTPTTIRECIGCCARLISQLQTKQLMWQAVKMTTIFNQDELIAEVKARLK